MAKGRKTGGRTKGTPNKITGELKGMVLAALDQAGGIDYLKARAKDTPTAFLALLGKVLPTEVKGPGEGGEHKVVGRVEWVFKSADGPANPRA